MIDVAQRTVRRGRFSRSKGALDVAKVHPDGSPLLAEVVIGVLVHEIAHAATSSSYDSSHSPIWRHTFKDLLLVATEDLGWRVNLECNTCALYDVCVPYDCPLCGLQPCRRR
jgi:hypothetical protein